MSIDSQPGTTDPAAVPLRPEAAECAKLRVVSVSELLGEAIRRIHNEESVSSLFV